jgi:hypothetical protein
MVNDVYEHSCTISEKLGNSSKLRDVYAEVLKDLEPGAAKSIAVHCPTRFGSRHIVMRDVLRSKKALKVLSQSEEWEAGLGDRGSKLKSAHTAMHNPDANLFDDAEKFEELLGPVMDAIHQLEADQPMLSYLAGVYAKLRAHFESFADNNIPCFNIEINEGFLPPDRRKLRPQSSPITLTESLDRDIEAAWRPCMSAAALLDPLNFVKNALGQYRLPFQGLEMDEIVETISAYSEGEIDVHAELRSLRLRSLDDSDGLLKELQVRKEVVGKAGKLRVLVRSHTERIAYLANELGESIPTCVKAAARLLAMPVTSCAAERNWSKWGKVCVANRANLGIETAEKMIFISQNDPETRLKRGEDGDTYTDAFVS